MYLSDAIGEDGDDDGFASGAGLLLGDLERGGDCRTGGDADEQAVLAPEGAARCGRRRSVSMSMLASASVGS